MVINDSGGRLRRGRIRNFDLRKGQFRLDPRWPINNGLLVHERFVGQFLVRVTNYELRMPYRNS